MSEARSPAPLPPAGLCGGCRHARVVTSGRASYLRCSRSDTDTRYERYPRLPMLVCAGFEAPSHLEPRS